MKVQIRPRGASSVRLKFTPGVTVDPNTALIRPTDSQDVLPLQDMLAGMGRTKAPPRKGFWIDKGAGANIWKFQDRVFVGTATEATGEEGGNRSSFGYAGWIERDAQMAVGSTCGMIAVLGQTKRSNRPNNPDAYGNRAAIAVGGIALSDLPGTTDGVWGGYFEGVRDTGCATVFGLEIAMKDRGGEGNAPTAYKRLGGATTVGIWLAGGSDDAYGGSSAGPSGAAIVIGKNTNTWHKGIVFDSGGLTGTDGTGTGRAVAIEMARGQAVRWMYGSVDGSYAGEIRAEAASINQATSIVFASGGLTINRLNGDGTENPLSVFPSISSAANYFSFNAAAAGSPPTIFAVGADTTIDLRLNPKGGGYVRFGCAPRRRGSPVEEDSTQRVVD